MSHQLLQHLVPVQTDVRDLRIAVGMTQLLAAERFDLSLRVWQMKESTAKPSPLSQGEYEFLLLLAGKHPFLDLTTKAR
ncbi:transcriptional regulator [Pantoea dispersa]|uniref:transcriptional regulator n=1 Tax=Pantoea dispersa TaxID=59814 RepID=UPI0032EC1293